MPVRDPDAKAAERFRRNATLTVLKEADELLADWSCEGSTECCRFSITGREPYLTEAEWAVVVAEVAAQGRKLPVVREDGVCPFLNDESKCSIYASRPLGCRSFYCDRASGPGGYPRGKMSQLPRRLENLSNERVRSLRSWLGGGRGRT